MTYRSSDQWPIDSTVESLLVIRFIREIQSGARSAKDRKRIKPVIRKKKKEKKDKMKRMTNNYVELAVRPWSKTVSLVHENLCLTETFYRD